MCSASGRVRRRRGNLRAEKDPQDHEPAVDNRGALGGRPQDQKARLRENTDAIGIAREIIRCKALGERGDAVDLGQRRTEFGFLVGEEGGEITALGQRHPIEETQRLLLHLGHQIRGHAQLRGRRSRIEPIELQPVLGIPFEPATSAGVCDHAIDRR
jgi:hypothetical protein